ncbi:MAG TPA: flavin oxidoreductase [Algoriphagus sp.]|jgi:flavin reductase (DIM6/NTAB) family NADH-FMN oxidoreductase RutF|uniref:flavin reductase family protein n=1 Tax=unclassified Algoriphagus TaxID=2641541 RepID=UPI000C54B3C7|nr:MULTISPECIES: flavin reductase [unclassified Algoriphagus]MAL15371.1 flavin oxidoreductase [Algoriphagus sp.]HAD50278.1 flavin oxidoreductase [Algoriphagus sp.]HAH37481.1 flavin oxidoreductase [Algoriphagus sp.]HAS58767.1 flavin oxidoreductase [Algoriphagus sp.]HAZ23647.1 flavin oxidoreductase [Algoriphagus sp.]|tara:strand:+ start:348 stop:977 length:630 start_codon:yes stop_codon:yes gene_type:complete
MIKHFSKEDILESDSFFRRNLINCLSGYKSLNLIGTKSKSGINNLAPFSQVFHIGASPPLVGILFRPHTVQRDTLENILETEVFTLNHVTPEFYKEAHWTSARWEGSEFEKTGLEEEYLEQFYAPFVKKSPLKLGCSLVETQTLKINETVLLIASIDHIYVEEKGLRQDGSLDLNILESVTVSGLDEYHVGEKLSRLSNAKPDKLPQEI